MKTGVKWPHSRSGIEGNALGLGSEPIKGPVILTEIADCCGGIESIKTLNIVALYKISCFM